MDLNKAQIIGRLTRDPEVRTTPSGVSVTSFGVATNFVWKDADGNRKEAVEFHNIVGWRRLGEIMGQYLRKGSRVFIEGRLQTRNWEGQDGSKRNRTEIVADNLIMLDSKRDNEAKMSESPTYESTSSDQPKKEDLSNEVSTSPEDGSTKGEVPTEAEEISVEDIPF